MPFFLSILLALLWLGTAPAKSDGMNKAVDSQTESSVVQELRACDIEPRQYAAIAEDPPLIQPWLLTQGDGAHAAELWNGFYSRLPKELSASVQPIQVLTVSGKDISDEEGFGTIVDVARIKSRLNGNAINVVYTDFPFANALRKTDGVYLRQKSDYLQSEDGFYSAAFEVRFLSWLAYINIE